ncbi:RNA pyrophosphohydrolase [Sphingomonadaceae bacterium G21617-S1]|jgi:putative (di)nucleoside polyphosphate hydrolase|uniref:RNA pyrophosphohydrolase n=1 Tax=Rhizorhabdus sp. TaxID=1968843 RepID=UPI001220D2C9|nr:RNA pyrophosphohydrolase [Rhizorhabdus sp.]MBD3761741.1 RNA pyrophosphohydrolase [Rhizorhabdus sp.]MCZ4340687.1 RNA pyrophosphohydrolase [Sphingomonadaceae bacterium G21617-S1]TAK08802.1 MAG: RNA pyrophosphohydrolase [Rhizorhabdus sp.]
MKKTLPYRPAAAIMLLNAENKVFVAQRIDNAADAWQMPQGGLDPGEDPQAGALRELEEETGIAAHLVEILGRAPGELLYDLPPELTGKIWGGKYRGQAQHWFVARFLGADADINIETAEPEFRAWKWVDAGELVDLIVPFKRDLYAQVVAAFAHHLDG